MMIRSRDSLTSSMVRITVGSSGGLSDTGLTSPIRHASTLNSPLIRTRRSGSSGGGGGSYLSM